MKDKKNLGIACFHFGIIKNPPFKYRQKEYVDKLKKTLNLITNLSDLKIDILEQNTSIDINSNQTIPSIEHGTGYFPPLNFTTIDFRLHIPKRIQKDILTKLYKFELNVDVITTEEFKITIMYRYHLPVTFVEPLYPSKDIDASESVIIVREFLRNEFRRIQTNYIKFECMGPSPFHANLSIEKTIENPSSKNWFINSKTDLVRGYDKVSFYYNPKIFKDIELAKEYIFGEICSELSIFYFIQALRVKGIRDWALIENKVEKLIEEEKRSKFFWRIFHAILPSNKINEVIILLTEFEVMELNIKDDIKDSYVNTYKTKSMGYLRKFVDDAIDELGHRPTEQLLQLVNTFNSQRIKNIENFFILISALLGAVLGSLFTIYFNQGIK